MHTKGPLPLNNSQILVKRGFLTPPHTSGQTDRITFLLLFLIPALFFKASVFAGDAPLRLFPDGNAVILGFSKSAADRLLLELACCV